ncbi:MAG TPA: hypothetical protein VHW92_11745 [Mycobacteriales bacterium]|jgi:hypothetical protein|nr:hypothetical protein [Mycobacteriales bacterium]
MSGTIVLVIVIVAVVVLAAIAIAAARSAKRRSALKQQFGPEYDRTVQDNDSRRKGERDLQARTERREQLDIRPLSADAAERYRSEWRMVQERFVDAPPESVAMAHTLLTSAMSDRGYPTSDQDERASLLSVDNADVVDHYRRGAETEQRWRTEGSSDTEDLRQAMQHYRAVFDRVVGASDTPVTGASVS